MRDLLYWETKLVQATADILRIRKVQRRRTKAALEARRGLKNTQRRMGAPLLPTVEPDEYLDLFPKPESFEPRPAQSEVDHCGQELQKCESDLAVAIQKSGQLMSRVVYYEKQIERLKNLTVWQRLRRGDSI